MPMASTGDQRAAENWWSIPMTYATNPRHPGATFVLVRGDVENQGEPVTAGVLSCVKALDSDDSGLTADAPEGQRRRQLAEWIASPRHPLTARVMANRLWQYHFGRGLVATPSDFGVMGERPSHPELLDWLAGKFIASDWSIKALHRSIMMSDTYRQTSVTNGRVEEWKSGRNTFTSIRPLIHSSAQSGDSDKLIGRFPLRRLEAEAVRDAMLAVSGQLNFEAGGPGFRPFTVFVHNSHFYTLTDPPTPEFQRRTVYRINVGSARSPLLDGLDCPEPSVKSPARSVTTTPLQALGLMNNAFVQRQAAHFAERLHREADTINAQVDRAYQLALGRLPTAAEAARAIEHACVHGLPSLCWTLLNASEFVYVR